MKLEIGYKDSFEIRREQQAFDHVAALSILYLPDLHFTGRSGNLMSVMCEQIEQLNPSFILLGGDYADTGGGFYWFTRFLKQIALRPFFAVAGNHDYFFGIEKIKQAVTNNNGTWIEKSSAQVLINGTAICIDGNVLTSEQPGTALKILCLHKPIPSAKASGYNLVFAGHLHGGQIVLWQTLNGLFPGKFFYKQNFLRQKLPRGNYFVSKGLGDTLPFRYNCKRDMVLVQITPAGLHHKT